MTTRQGVLLVLNLALTVLLFGNPLLLAVYVGLGWVLVRNARIGGVVALALWVATWLLFRPGAHAYVRPLERALSLGPTNVPELIGASYVFLKVYDLMRRAQRSEKVPSFAVYLTQVTFAPSFLCGPIAGPETFEGGFAPSRALAAEGLGRVLAGALKVWILVPLIQPSNVTDLARARVLDGIASPLELWLAVYAVALWIYLEFSGLSDFAIGTGLLMGVRLPENFDFPYLAASPTEFWQRWHRTFTTWLAEHVFAPVSRALASRAGSSLALVLAVAATMAVCGLWHGLTVSFLAWGLYHALVVSGHQLYATRLRPRLAPALVASRPYRVAATATTFHAVALGWVFFFPTDGTLGEHLSVLGRLFAW